MRAIIFLITVALYISLFSSVKSCNDQLKKQNAEDIRHCAPKCKPYGYKNRNRKKCYCDTYYKVVE